MVKACSTPPQGRALVVAMDAKTGELIWSHSLA